MRAKLKFVKMIDCPKESPSGRIYRGAILCVWRLKKWDLYDLFHVKFICAIPVCIRIYNCLIIPTIFCCSSFFSCPYPTFSPLSSFFQPTSLISIFSSAIILTFFLFNHAHFFQIYFNIFSRTKHLEFYTSSSIRLSCAFSKLCSLVRTTRWIVRAK